MPSEEKWRTPIRKPDWFEGVPHEDTGLDDWLSGAHDNRDESS
jgi:hypothetical protein